MSNSRTRTRTTGPSTWAGAVRNPWTVLCVAATVVLGPAAATASALDQANKAPLHQAAKHDRAPHPHLPGAGPAQAYLPSAPTRRRVA